MAFLTIVEEDERIDVKIEESVIFCRRYSVAVAEKIEKPFKRRRKDRQGRFYTDVDEDGLNKAVLDYIITGWQDVVNNKAENVPCTIETKLALPESALSEIYEKTGVNTVRKQEGNDVDTDPLEQ